MIRSLCRSDRARPDGGAALIGSSECCSSQAVSASVSTGEPEVHARGSRDFGLSSRTAYMNGASMREVRSGVCRNSHLDVRADDDQRARWGATHHLQERLADVRTLPFSIS